MKKVCIVGAGAIGGTYAALLKKGGAGPLLIDTDPEKVRLISERGLTVAGWGNFKFTITNKIPQEKQELILIATKTYLNEMVYPSLAPMIFAETIIFTLQNGFGNGEALAKLYPAGQICLGSTYRGAICAEPGLVLPRGEGLTIVAPWLKEKPERAQKVAQFLTACGIANQVEADGAKMIWQKLILNSVANPLTAIHGVKNGEILTDQKLFAKAKALIREAVAVANLYGFDFKVEKMQKLCFGTLKRVAENQSSMLQDKLAGRPLEIDSINGAIVKLAQAKGLAVPVNEEVLAALK